MRGNSTNLMLLLAALAGAASAACQSGGVGDPCIPEDEYRTDFSGFSASEVNVESRSFQCETRVCLSAYFNGRVSCPYGQAVNKSGQFTGPRCYVPGAKPAPENEVTVPVDPQIVERPRDKAVYCSCRCDGPDKNARYCECPSGYACQKLVDDLGFGTAQLAGSYCVKDGTQVADPSTLKATGTPCSAADTENAGSCGKRYPAGL